jgi:hypothetical protein
MGLEARHREHLAGVLVAYANHADVLNLEIRLVQRPLAPEDEHRHEEAHANHGFCESS